MLNIHKFLLVVCGLSFSIILSFASLYASSPTMKIIGHRGACGYAPENTLSSFQLALDMSVDMVELDVFVCATGELVVIHDDTVDRTTNGHGNVEDMTFTQLRSLIVEGKEQIPTLQEVIELVNRRVPINIELKGADTAQPVAQLLKKYLAQGWAMQDFIISSFDYKQVREFKKLCPTIKIGILLPWQNMPIDLVTIAQRYQADFIGIDVKVITKKMVSRAHQAGFLIFVWTVNDKKTADKLRSLNVDGIFSEYPDQV